MSRRKFLLKMTDHPAINELWQKHRELTNQGIKEVEFFQKKYDLLLKKKRAADKEFWTNIKPLLIEMGVVDKERFNTSLEIEADFNDDCIYEHEPVNPLEASLRKMGLIP